MTQSTETSAESINSRRKSSLRKQSTKHGYDGGDAADDDDNDDDDDDDDDDDGIAYVLSVNATYVTATIPQYAEDADDNPQVTSCPQC